MTRHRPVRDTLPPTYPAPPKSRSTGNTEAHYLPLEPRAPATAHDTPHATVGIADLPITFHAPALPLTARATPDYDEDPPTLPELPLLQLPINMCPICQIGAQVTDLPEIAAWSCGHWTCKKPQSIAEAFQDMLRATFQAGIAAATSGEAFETWYQREVLR